MGYEKLKNNPWKYEGGSVVDSLGVMGGTFNPIHFGHLVAAQESMSLYQLDRVLFVPNRTPPHRMGEPGLISYEDRYVMGELAIAENPRFFVSRIEIDRSDVSYTYETIKGIRDLFPHAEISFIAGLDSLMEYRWYQLDDLLGMLRRFIAVTRPGFSCEDFSRCVGELNLVHAERIEILEIPGIHISSTLIRSRIREGKSIRYLVPGVVETYIRKNGLYLDR